ncbi:HEAT repeat domain-containing protein [Patescibacteria group bacterium]|nr:HEAT repeat domain-containing protein [Patescibacteria group bacterium]MCL5091242.1 HEAT repeat domain-containing protein [Patescibacteria group bacterium]
MGLLDEIRKTNKKPKALNMHIARLITEHPPSAVEFSQALALGNDVERGTCIEALEYATQTDPEIARPYLAEVIKRLTDKAPRVKWEAARVIANVAMRMPKAAEKAIDALLSNSQDKGTVVRWSAALALGEIMKHDAPARPRLLKEINTILKQEKNTGVRNVYLKAIKIMT